MGKSIPSMDLSSLSAAERESIRQAAEILKGEDGEKDGATMESEATEEVVQEESFLETCQSVADDDYYPRSVRRIAERLAEAIEEGRIDA